MTAEKNPEILSDELLKGPFGGLAMELLLSRVAKEIFIAQTNIRINTDPVELAIIDGKIDPNALHVLDKVAPDRYTIIFGASD